MMYALINKIQHHRVLRELLANSFWSIVGTFISKIDWSKSESLKNLFLPFMYLGEEKE